MVPGEVEPLMVLHLDVKVLLQIPDARYRKIKHERWSQTTFREGAGKRPTLVKQN
jgi:hypothetical protein